jgi:hypothetical protein
LNDPEGRGLSHAMVTDDGRVIVIEARHRFRLMSRSSSASHSRPLGNKSYRFSSAGRVAELKGGPKSRSSSHGTPNQ